MRFLVPFFVICCCAVTGYSQDTTDSSPAEVTATEDGASPEIANVDSHNDGKGCPCGGGNKPKV